MMILKLSGWQRLKVVLSIFLISVVFTYVTYEVSTNAPRYSKEIRGVDDIPTDSGLHFIMSKYEKTLAVEDHTERIGKTSEVISYKTTWIEYVRVLNMPSILLAMAIPLGVIWLLIPIAAWAVRWIREGFIRRHDT